MLLFTVIHYYLTLIATIRNGKDIVAKVVKLLRVKTYHASFNCRRKSSLKCSTWEEYNTLKFIIGKTMSFFIYGVQAFKLLNIFVSCIFFHT